MTLKLTALTKTALLSAALLTLSPAAFASGLSATATYTDVQTSPGVYDYTLTLNNTGTTNIGTFWFAWIPGDGFINSGVLSVQSPMGWTDTVTNSGTAVRWTTTSDPLMASSSLSGFSFTSMETPAELAGTTLTTAIPGTNRTPTPILEGTSFVYIGRPFGDPGYEFVATAVPEPPSSLLALGGVGIAAAFNKLRRLRIRRS